MPRCTLGRGAALRHVERVDAVVRVLAGRVHRHPPHVVECRVERQPCAHPQVHVGAEIVARCPKIVFVITWKNDAIRLNVKREGEDCYQCLFSLILRRKFSKRALQSISRLPQYSVTLSSTFVNCRH